MYSTSGTPPPGNAPRLVKRLEFQLFPYQYFNPIFIVPTILCDSSKLF
jgi:hypothetical protein